MKVCTIHYSAKDDYCFIWFSDKECSACASGVRKWIPEIAPDDTYEVCIVHRPSGEYFISARAAMFPGLHSKYAESDFESSMDWASNFPYDFHKSLSSLIPSDEPFDIYYRRIS